MITPHLIVLCGLRCSGKTTTGRMLAARLGTAFTDLDDAVAETEGASPAEIITGRGLPAFREAEHRTLARLLTASDRGGVLALGGGAPTHPPIAELLTAEADNSRLALVYLRAAPEVLAERLRSKANASTRPALTGTKDPATEVHELSAQRDPLYRSLATMVIETGKLDSEVIVERVLAALAEG